MEVTKWLKPSGSGSRIGDRASLSGLALPDTTITAAQSVAAGTYTAPDGEVFTNLPAFCRIAATMTPTSDSNIKIEVWMPYSGWNRRYLGTGNGGIGGLIVYGTLAFFLPFNYAVANTDMGTTPAATDPLGSRVLTGHPHRQPPHHARGDDHERAPGSARRSSRESGNPSTHQLRMPRP